MKRSEGFTLIELMIVVAIVGILSSVAMSTYAGFLVKTYIAEGKTLMMDIQSKQEESFNSGFGFRTCNYNPSSLPINEKVLWESQPCWEELGVQPTGGTRWQYRTVGSHDSGPDAITAARGIDPNSEWYYVEALADLDGDGDTQQPTQMIVDSVHPNLFSIYNEGQ